MINLNLEALARIANAATKESTRYYLQVVRIEPCGTGALMVATDGQVLACEYDPDGVCSEAMSLHVQQIDNAVVTNKAWCKVNRALKPNNSRLHLPRPGWFNLTNNAATTEPCAFITNPDVGTFPEWRRVLPRVTADNIGTDGCYNTDVLARLMATAPGKVHGVAMFQDGRQNPILVRQEESPNWFGVLMPWRKPPSGETWPRWFNR